MGKSSNFFMKVRDIKGTFHAKVGTIKDRKCINLTEAENIKKRCQEYTEELYKEDLNDPDNHDGVVTHLEPDILECESANSLEKTLKLGKIQGKKRRGQQRIKWLDSITDSMDVV